MLTIFTLPAYSFARSARIGSKMRHGAHQSAPKSMSTGCLQSSTSLEKFASLTCMTRPASELVPDRVSASGGVPSVVGACPHPGPDSVRARGGLAGEIPQVGP